MSNAETGGMTRRGFLEAAAAAAPLIVPATVFGGTRRVAPGSRITIGMIGMGRQALFFNLKEFLQMPDVQVVALCDVDAWRLANAKKAAEDHYGQNMRSGRYKGCQIYRNFRELLANKRIDAVMISTPDHWHVPISMEAVKAGKDVSCEKPLTRSIAEGRALSDLVAKHKRVFRTDSEFRSIKVFHRACELVRNGRIGKLHTIRTGVPGDATCPPQPEMPVPEDLDYEMWQGPAPRAPYTENRVHKPKAYERPGWMRHLYYCDGMVTNWGTHLNDIAQWGNGTDRTGPVEVEGRGQYPPPGNFWNVLLNFEIHYRYADDVRLIYKTERPYVKFEGSEGWILAGYPEELKAEPASILNASIPPDGIRFPLKQEKRDFIDAVKSRGQTLEDAEVGHRTTSLCHLGHIAIQLGKKLQWDPIRERFTNSDTANEFIGKPIHTPRSS